MPEFLLVQICERATSFCQLQMRRAVTPSIARWSCKSILRTCGEDDLTGFGMNPIFSSAVLELE